MITIADEMLAWIQFAIGVERNGKEFYKQCLATIDDQRAKELFKFLVDAETKHEAALQKLLEEKSGGDPRKIKQSEEEFNRLGMESGLFTQEQLKRIKDKNTMIMEMFNIASNMEKNGINIYLDLEQKQTDPDMKAFFHNLAKQELQHRKQIDSIGMSLFGMESDEEELTEKQIEKELAMQKVIEKPITIIAKDNGFEPREIRVNKGETIILTIRSPEAPVGFRSINFGIDEFIGKGQETTVKFLADTAGYFEFYSNVPHPGGNEGFRGKLIIEGENEPDETL